MNVLLVHGLGRTPWSFFSLAASLRRAGFRPHFFAYSPTLESLPRIISRLRARLHQFAGHPVSLIGHSLPVEVQQLPVWHSFMMNAPTVHASIRRALC